MLQVERCGMAHVGAQFTPFGVCAAVGKLYQVEGIVDIRLQIVECYMELFAIVLELARQSYAYNWQRSSADFL